MLVLNESLQLQKFFEDLAVKREGFLLLDYDGTLAPFKVQRDKAFPYPGIIEKLNKINATKTKLFIVSGRSIQDLLPLIVGLDPLPALSGSHGIEFQTPDGKYFIDELSDAMAQGLKIGKEICQTFVDAEKCELKPSSVAVHWRKLRNDHKAAIRKIIWDKWLPITQKYPLEIHKFDGGLELRPAGKNKGDVIRQLLAKHPQHPPLAYLGDDETDEDAFKAIASRGLKVLVRKEKRASLADLQITPPEQLNHFLDRWLHCCV